MGLCKSLKGVFKNKKCPHRKKKKRKKRKEKKLYLQQE
jgi:hypothetical protein